MYCKNCGAQMPDGAEFCAACGSHMKPSSNTPQSGLPIQQSQPSMPPRQSYQPPRRNNTVIIGAIAAVAVVLIAAIVCFTVLTHGKQQAQLAQIQAEEQQAQREAEEKKTAEEKATKEEEKKAAEEAEAKAEEEKKKEEAEKKAEEEEEQQISSTTVNNYYYYNTGNPSDDYYTAVTSSGYLWPTDTQYITASDLSGLSRDTVAAIRNEIYARHGYAFQQRRWQQYFAAKSWYYRDESCTESTVSSRLSSVEKTNIDTIVKYEESMGWR